MQQQLLLNDKDVCLKDLSDLQALDPDFFPALLESHVQTETQHFDLLFAAPQARLTLAATREQPLLRFTDEVAWLNPADDFLSNLDRWFTDQTHSIQTHSIRNQSAVTVESDRQALNLPFEGGWFIYLSYELVYQIEPSLADCFTPLLSHNSTLPIAEAVRIPLAVIYDRLTRQWFIVVDDSWLAAQPTAEVIRGLLDSPVTVQTLMAETRLNSEFRKLVRYLQQWINITGHNREVAPVAVENFAEEAPERYLQGIETIQQHIVDGDVFQINLSRQWDLVLPPVEPATLYQRLSQVNPAPFASLMHWNQQAVVSSSPERLVEVRQGSVSTRPIAGTRPRGATPEQDVRLIQELGVHPKEQAEHIMLIDLERNDLGRICQTGSVMVDELMAIETYPHVHHIVSNVRGQLKPDCLPGEVIRAVFPGGTITGCPKVRCMEILVGLEQQARSAYTGSLGYLNLNGDMDLNILIRTMIVQQTQNQTQVSFRTGGGIVMDSQPDAELAETKAKAQGLLNVFDR